MVIKLVKEIHACDLVFETWSRYSGFFSHVWVYVPDPAALGKLCEEFCSSCEEFRTAEEAEEKAAERMTQTLERSCNFETKDLNQEDKRRFRVDSCNSCVGWRGVKEENKALKMKV
jgi:hypothetical protein